MGQSTSPLIKKLGQNLHWDNIWIDKFNYTKKLKEDIFINMFFFLIFKKITSQTKFFKSYYFKNLLSHNFTNLNRISTLYFYQNIFLTKVKFFKKNKASYLGKIWILKFNNWVILLTNYYVPQFAKFNLKKAKQKNNNKIIIYSKQLKLIQLYSKFFLQNKNKFL